MEERVVHSQYAGFILVSGKPYVSANAATMNAENAPNQRQSVRDCGRAKLNATAMNTTELTWASVESP